MTEGQDQIAHRKLRMGLKLLRAAYELDENNSLARAVLANALGGAGSFHCKKPIGGRPKNLPRRRSI